MVNTETLIHPKWVEIKQLDHFCSALRIADRNSLLNLLCQPFGFEHCSRARRERPTKFHGLFAGLNKALQILTAVPKKDGYEG